MAFDAAFGVATFAGATFGVVTFTGAAFATPARERDDVFAFMFLAAFVATGFTFDAEGFFDAKGCLDAEGRAAALLATDFRVAASTRAAAFLGVAVLVGLTDLVFATDLDEALAEAEGRAAAVRVDDFLSDLVVELGIARFSDCQERLR